MKDEIRHRQKIKRKYLNDTQRGYFDEVIANTFLAAFGGYESYFIYNSFGTEADTSRIISALLKENKRVLLPRVEGGNMVAVPYAKTKTGAFGIEEPEGQAVYKAADVTVIPLLAVNEKGCRIGYGKGFYDRYLKDKKTVKVGLGYYFQLENFEGDTWDEPLDFFISERGILKFGNYND